jgi:hypothetical protein
MIPRDKFQADLATGVQGEEMLMRLARAYVANREDAVEVKNDLKVGDTGNVYIETVFNGRASGLDRYKAPWWCIVFDGALFGREVMVLIDADRLRQICEKYGRPSWGDGDNGLAQGWIIPATRLLTPL